MISPKQAQLARIMLDLSQADLAEKLGWAHQTVSKIEKGSVNPPMSRIKELEGFYENAGVEFIDGDGVKRRNARLSVLEGEGANHTMLNDIYDTLKHSGGEILIANLQEIEEHEGENYKKITNHISRLRDAGITEKILTREGDMNFLAPEEWYRWIPEKYFGNGTFQLYGDKLAMIQWEETEQVIIVENALIAESFRGLFGFAWDFAKKPPHKK